MRRERMNPHGEMPDLHVQDLRNIGKPIQIRWDFREEADEMEGGDPIISWSFLVVTVPDLQEQTLQAAGVPQEIINQIIN